MVLSKRYNCVAFLKVILSLFVKESLSQLQCFSVHHEKSQPLLGTRNDEKISLLNGQHSIHLESTLFCAAPRSTPPFRCFFNCFVELRHLNLYRSVLTNSARPMLTWLVCPPLFIDVVIWVRNELLYAFGDRRGARV